MRCNDNGKCFRFYLFFICKEIFPQNKLPFSEVFRAPAFLHGADKNGFSLGVSKNFRQVFGDEKKYWLLPVFSRYLNLYNITAQIMWVRKIVKYSGLCGDLSQGDGCSYPTCLVNADPEQPASPSGHAVKRSVSLYTIIKSNGLLTVIFI